MCMRMCGVVIKRGDYCAGFNAGHTHTISFTLVCIKGDSKVPAQCCEQVLVEENLSQIEEHANWK